MEIVRDPGAGGGLCSLPSQIRELRRTGLRSSDLGRMLATGQVAG